MEYVKGAGNLQLVDELLLAPGQSSYRSEVSEFLSKDYDAILWQLTDATASAFFSSAAEIGVLDGRYFVGTDAALAEETIRILAPYLGTATFTAVVPATDGAGLESYRSAYRSEFGSEPLVLADIGYDATTTLLLAAEQAGDLAPEAIAARIPEVTAGGEACVDFKTCAALIRAGKDADFEGAGNSLTFDETHNVTSNYVISEIAPDGTVTEKEKVTEEQIRTLVDAAQ
jgi:ABC-type branched-subunit amino acid transport system substrate-binding protein